MRHFAASVILFGLIHSYAAGQTAAIDDVSTSTPATVARGPDSQGLLASPIAQNTGTEPSSPVTAEPDNTQSSSTDAPDLVCQTLQAAARQNDLPLDYLTRLIWQESRFDAHAVSRAGAQGIAQFMPGTAAWVGLGDPFDAAEAIAKSAELLRKLKSQFGNLGLAAAAYNAGPKRVTDWLAGHRDLPRETRAYVVIVTGLAADAWRGAIDRPSLNLPEGVPCPQIAKLFASGGLETPKLASGADDAKSVNNSAAAQTPWGVQLIGGPSQISVLASYRQLQLKYQSVLESRQPLVIRSQTGKNASWYRVRIAAQTLAEAERLCGSLRAAGGSCLVQRN